MEQRVITIVAKGIVQVEVSKKALDPAIPNHVRVCESDEVFIAVEIRLRNCDRSPILEEGPSLTIFQLPDNLAEDSIKRVRVGRSYQVTTDRRVGRTYIRRWRGFKPVGLAN